MNNIRVCQISVAFEGKHVINWNPIIPPSIKDVLVRFDNNTDREIYVSILGPGRDLCSFSTFVNSNHFSAIPCRKSHLMGRHDTQLASFSEEFQERLCYYTSPSNQYSSVGIVIGFSLKISSDTLTPSLVLQEDGKEHLVKFSLFPNGPSLGRILSIHGSALVIHFWTLASRIPLSNPPSFTQSLANLRIDDTQR